jgi:hypothetical protein
MFRNAPAVDHSAFQYLNINKATGDTGISDNLSNGGEEGNGGEMRFNRGSFPFAIGLNSNNSYIEKNKKLSDLDQVIAPSFEQKKKLRDDMFFFLEDSTIEETRLEIEIDQAKEKGDKKKVEELSDALFLLQRMHGERLINIITEYHPQPISKTWGQDPEYSKLSRQLVNLSEQYAVHEENNNNGKHGHRKK